MAQIAASIKEFGFTNPILIDEANTIIAGEGRVLAAKKLQMETVPCLVLTGLTGAQKAAYVIADNKIALGSGWDTDLLLEELGRIADLEIDTNLTGFSEVEIIALFEGLHTEVGDAPTEESQQGDWSVMPEFHQPDDKAFRTVIVHFNDQSSVDAFATLIGKNITEKTKYLWYPEMDRPGFRGGLLA